MHMPPAQPAVAVCAVWHYSFFWFLVFAVMHSTSTEILQQSENFCSNQLRFWRGPWRAHFINSIAGQAHIETDTR